MNTEKKFQELMAYKAVNNTGEFGDYYYLLLLFVFGTGFAMVIAWGYYLYYDINVPNYLYILIVIIYIVALIVWAVAVSVGRERLRGYEKLKCAETKHYIADLVKAGVIKKANGDQPGFDLNGSKEAEGAELDGIVVSFQNKPDIRFNGILIAQVEGACYHTRTLDETIRLYYNEDEGEGFVVVKERRRNEEDTDDRSSLVSRSVFEKNEVVKYETIEGIRLGLGFYTLYKKLYSEAKIPYIVNM